MYCRHTPVWYGLPTAVVAQRSISLHVHVPSVPQAQAILILHNIDEHKHEDQRQLQYLCGNQL